VQPAAGVFFAAAGDGIEAAEQADEEGSQLPLLTGGVEEIAAGGHAGDAGGGETEDAG
jgi:hypothetical protein